MDSITTALVRVNGRVDDVATRDAFASQLAKHIASCELEESTIADAVSAVFDTHKGVPLAMPILCNFSLTELNAQPENYKTLHERTAQYVRDNSQGEKDKATGLVANPDSLFVIAKGKHGGVRRRSDIVTPAAE